MDGFVDRGACVKSIGIVVSKKERCSVLAFILAVSCIRLSSCSCWRILASPIIFIRMSCSSRARSCASSVLLPLLLLLVWWLLLLLLLS